MRFQRKLRHGIHKLIGHNDSSAKGKLHSIKCPHKEIGEISYEQFKSTFETYRTKRNNHTQEE